jgi:CheY-like chemotaxis protein
MKTILVVDDELCKPANAEMFRREYATEGIEYIFAGSGEEMFELLSEHEAVSLILLDIRFEGIGGAHGLSLLKQLNDEGQPIPVIMMSSLSDAGTIIKAWELGAQGYVLKWASNPRFFEDLKDKIHRYAHEGKPASDDLVERRRNRIKIRARNVLKEHSQLTFDDIIAQALALKAELGVSWVNSPPFPSSFQNYICGWNEQDAVIRDAEANHRLLYLNMDFGDGCTLRCPHCFTHEGAIDSRGRTPLPFDQLKASILEAKEMGLRCVRILGRGEPTQWIYNPSRSGLVPRQGEDLIDFIRFLHANGIIPLVFSRGQIIGDDARIDWAFGGAHGVRTGADLVRLLGDSGVSLFLGMSSIFPEINNEMVGIPSAARYDYDVLCRRALSLAVKAGLNQGHPTRLAVEMPITNLNIMEMGVRYVLFQMLNISPCTNVYMVAGRAMTYGLGEITDPAQEQFLDHYAMVTRFARNMGIDIKIGSYAGTKECHDVSCGMYLTLNGDIYPCPGYEGIQSFVGSLRTHSMRQIWENSPYGGHPQSICPPKIGTHFPPDFEAKVEEYIATRGRRYDDVLEMICSKLGVPRL